MSSTEETGDLKAGHPPAVKVAGGMRVAQHKTAKPAEGSGATEPSAEEEFDEEQLVVKEKPAALYISGAETKGDKDFPAQAVKSFHEKPHPTHEKRPAVNQPKHINQPRKQ